MKGKTHLLRVDASFLCQNASIWRWLEKNMNLLEKKVLHISLVGIILMV